jgi:hypothetical protein
MVAALPMKLPSILPRSVPAVVRDEEHSLMAPRKVVTVGFAGVPLSRISRAMLAAFPTAKARTMVHLVVPRRPLSPFRGHSRR